MPAGRRAVGALTPPPSKSLTQRYLIAALLAEGETVVGGPLRSADTAIVLDALRAAGAAIADDGSAVRIGSGATPAEVDVDCGANGTLLRLLLGVAASRPGLWRLDGSRRLRERPIGPLVSALASLGGVVRYRGEEGFAPVEVRGGRLRGGRVTIDAGASSQFVSALLLAAAGSPEAVEVSWSALSSAPYVDLTIDCLTRFGARIVRSGDGARVEPSPLFGCRVRIEPDASSACYPAAAAAVTGGRVLLRDLPQRTAQGDAGFLDLLREMGAHVSRSAEGVLVEGRRLAALSVDLSHMPDQVPTLAALAPFASGTTRITGVPHLRLKESDRLAVMAAQLTRLGARARELPDGLEIPGVWAEAEPPATPVVTDAVDDHRIAMSLALVALRRPNLRIGGWRAVEKSYPGFWVDLDGLLAEDR